MKAAIGHGGHTAARLAASLGISVALLVTTSGLSGCKSVPIPFYHAHAATTPQTGPTAQSSSQASRVTQPAPVSASAIGRRGAAPDPALKGSHPPREWLDPVTAASITVVASPIVFARAHQDVSSNSRQFATVAAVSVNRSGHFDYMLLVYLWSTVDPRLAADVHPGETVVLLADDRAIKLTRDGRTLKEAGLAHPVLAPAHTRGPPRLYRIDKATLQFISRARRLRLQLDGDEDPRPFDVWTDGRPDLARFAATSG